MVLTDTGRVYTWGNSNLGNGKEHRASNPEIVEYFERHSIRIVHISAGATHCACISTKNEVYTWGVGESGRLGHGNNSDAHIPRMIAEFTGINIIHVNCGRDHTMFADEDGVAYGCGSLQYGKVGAMIQGVETCFENPRKIGLRNPSFNKIVEVHAGINHSLALNMDNLIFSFGRDSNGVLGVGKNSTSTVPGIPCALYDPEFYVPQSIRLKKVNVLKVLEYKK